MPKVLIRRIKPSVITAGIIDKSLPHDFPEQVRAEKGSWPGDWWVIFNGKRWGFKNRDFVKGSDRSPYIDSPNH